MVIFNCYVSLPEGKPQYAVIQAIHKINLVNPGHKQLPFGNAVILATHHKYESGC